MNDELFPPYPPNYREPHPAEKVQEVLGIMDAVGWGLPVNERNKIEEQDCSFCPSGDKRKVGRGLLGQIYRINGVPACQPCFEVHAIAENGNP